MPGGAVGLPPARPLASAQQRHLCTLRGAVCVECGEPATVLREVRASSTSIRLSRCGSCGQIADKYVEFDTLLVLLDMLLHRTSVYRHLLCNCQRTVQEARRKNLLISGLVLLLCEPSLKGIGSTRLLDHQSASSYSAVAVYGGLSERGPFRAVATELVLCFAPALLGFATFCTVALAASRALLEPQASCHPRTQTSHHPAQPPLHPATRVSLLTRIRIRSLRARQRRQLCHWRSIAACVLLSSLGKSFALLPAIWDYGSMRVVFTQATGLFVLACNCVALRVQLRCDTLVSVLVVGIAAAARAACELSLELALSPGSSLPTILSLVSAVSGAGLSRADGDSSADCADALGPCASLGTDSR